MFPVSRTERSVHVRATPWFVASDAPHARAHPPPRARANPIPFANLLLLRLVPKGAGRSGGAGERASDVRRHGPGRDEDEDGPAWALQEGTARMRRQRAARLLSYVLHGTYFAVAPERLLLLRANRGVVCYEQFPPVKFIVVLVLYFKC